MAAGMMITIVRHLFFTWYIFFDFSNMNFLAPRPQGRTSQGRFCDGWIIVQ